MKNISLRGVRTNNLKNINIDIPRNKVTVLTGLSGSGKTSLAFDTIYAYAQKEYLESISTFNRRGQGKIKSPKVKSVKGLSPAIAIEQKKLGNNPRSTVGTYTEIYTYLRLLFSRFGKPQKPLCSAGAFSFNNPKGACTKCRGLGVTFVISVNKLIDFDKTLREGAVKNRYFGPGSYKLKIIESSGKFDFDKPLKDFTKKELDEFLYAPPAKVERKNNDEYKYWSCEGIVATMNRLRRRRNKSKIERGEELSKYNMEYYKELVCPKCMGQKLNANALNKRICGLNISDVSDLSIDKLLLWISKVQDPKSSKLCQLLKVKCQRLIDLGLEYLSLNRPIPTLSGGESQRVKLARHLGMNLIEMIYILDEPTIGMHPINIKKIIKIMRKLRDKGNTVIVVEHDLEVIKSADYIIDIGPKAGKEGGKIVAKGSIHNIKGSNSLTARVLNNKWKPVNTTRDRSINEYLTLNNLRLNNLKIRQTKIAQNALNLIVGVSGAGKSSLIEEFIKVHSNSTLIDQSAIGKSNRSNPATYSNLFDLIRKEFATVAKCSSQLLSFNSIGRCEKCKGLGTVKIDMHFMEDVELTCDRCKGKRYNKEALKIKYKGYTISDILNFSVDKALKIFESKKVLEKLTLLKDVGLSYIKLGQSSLHLSGGESQRVKLAKYLYQNGNVLILDEPTVGLHACDIDKLLTLIHRIIDKGNTVIIVEHNTDVIKNADWIVELGPGGGDKGGKLVFEGRMKDIRKCKNSLIKNYI
ncbi:ATP-binding cassette domain-containing protein [Patescibacteria group bacterium]